MRNIVLTSMLLVFLPLLAVAQTNDDLYFIPKKNKETKKVEVVSKEVSARTVDASMSSSAPSVVVRDTKGNIRDVDEYNRRYTSRDNKFSSDGETLYVDEKPYDERGEWVNGFQGSDMDYEYAMRIVRFRSPRYAIPVSSPLYWDVVYGALPSWDWNVYDDGMYAYVFPTYTNRLWWDWRWSSSFYGPSFGFSMSWGSPWYYSNWHSPYWYDRWYGGYWGHHHHCCYYDYPYYGGWYGGSPRKHYNYNNRRAEFGNPGRGNSYRDFSAGSSNGRYTQSAGLRDNNGRTGGRVVSGGRNSSSSVRSSSSGVSRRNNNASYSRPSRLSERGSSYSRPSSTRVNTSTNRYNDSNRNNRYNFNNSNSSNRNSVTTTRSFGGSSYRSTTTSGGSSRSTGGISSRSTGGGAHRR